MDRPRTACDAPVAPGLTGNGAHVGRGTRYPDGEPSLLEALAERAREAVVRGDPDHALELLLEADRIKTSAIPG